MVFGTAWRVLGNAADADDVVQDVFLEAHQLTSTRPVRHWPGFLRRLVACRALDRLRQRTAFVTLDERVAAPNNEGPHAVAIAGELADRLREAIAELPEREAQVFCLRCFEALSYKEIGDSLDISPNAAAVALYKARAKLEFLLSEAPKGE